MNANNSREILNRKQIDIVIGHPITIKNQRYNACLWLSQGIVIHQSFKQYLPNHSVFNESRYFKPAQQPNRPLSRWGYMFLVERLFLIY